MAIVPAVPTENCDEISTSAPTYSSRDERNARARRTEELVAKLVDATGERRRHLLDQLVEENMGVARAVAGRYRNRGVGSDDLDQVAYAALVRVAHAFDPAAGHDFLSYAVPSMRGEVRRYFRDCGWTVRPPRRIQELQARITGTESQLSTSLGRPPRVGELAEELHETSGDIEEALAANGCFTPTSLDEDHGDSSASSIGDGLGDEESGYGAVEARVALEPALRRLGERDRRIVTLRFFGDCTQQQIADEIGVTQMQVSRLLSSIYDTLRRELMVSAPRAS